MRLSCVIAITLLLSACGGGQSGDPTDSGATVPPPVKPIIPIEPILPTTAPDPSIAGEYIAIDQDYDFGRLNVSDEVNGNTYETDIHGYILYPQDAPGPFPVVLFQHGRHQTCETGPGQAPVLVGDDNCPDLAPVITPANSYRGYDYIAQNMVSHGYAVISVDTNDVNDNDGGPGNSDTGALARAELLLAHLDAFRDINTNGGNDFDQLQGKLDFSRVGLMGHSRGGEGVDKAVTVNASREFPHNLRAVFALAPTDYLDQDISGVVFATLLPYCDGDVEDLMGSFAYDNARYRDPADSLPKFQILAMGSNHNYFNTIWNSDDWEIHGTALDSHCGREAADNGRDTPAEQRALGEFFIASFFRHFIGGEDEFSAYWGGQAQVPASACPSGIGPCPERYHLSIQPGFNDRLLVDTTLNDTALTINALGGQVGFEGFADFNHCVIDGRSGNGCIVAEPTFAAAPMVYLNWIGSATYSSELGDIDVSDYDMLSVRVGVSLGDLNNAGGQDFEIALIDSAGGRSAVNAADFSAALFDPPGDRFAAGGSEKTTLNAIRIPLSAFGDVDTSSLDSLEFVFTQTSAGTIQLTDVMFQRKLQQ
jgi:dienelactone hydrolase